MKSMRIFLVFWVSGLIAGVILMERWRRHGGRYVPVEAIPRSLDESPTDAVSTTPAGKPNLVGLVVTGAKLDAERVKQRLGSSKPSHSSAE
jgi:hypothetical protein